VLKKVSSATLPPRIQQILSTSSYLVSSEDSLGKYYAYPKLPLLLGIIVSFGVNL
jgi:hypothetical protein